MRKLLINVIVYGTVAFVTLLMCFENCAGETVNDFLTTLPNYTHTELVKVQEVAYGDTAVLICYSNDQEHFFQFWQLAKEESVVGPGNKYNGQKYDYEILSGNLIIREVSTDEEGIYHCVSKGIRENDINIRSVRMVVHKGMDEVNYFRGVVITGSILVIGVAAYFVYRMKKRHRLQHLLEEDDDDEEDAEEIFRAPGTSRDTRSIIVNKEEDDPVEIPKISIDFEDILSNSQK